LNIFLKEYRNLDLAVSLSDLLIYFEWKCANSRGLVRLLCHLFSVVFTKYHNLCICKLCIDFRNSSVLNLTKNCVLICRSF